MSDNGIETLLAQARSLAASAEDDAAKQIYLAILQRDATHFAALNELGTLAYESGHRSASRTAYRQAVQFHPDNPIGRVNLGNLLLEDGELAAARAQYEAALALDPELADAHLGLARVLTEVGKGFAAAPHWQKGFAGRALVTRRYRGTAPAVPVLLLVSARGGNIPTRLLLDDRVFAITALYAEFFDSKQPLPPHAVVFNAIGDADLCGDALAAAEKLVAKTDALIVNPPSVVRQSGRAENAARLKNLPGVVAPAIRAARRLDLLGERGLRFPLLLRAPGFHTGRHFVKVDRQEDLAPAIATLPGPELFVIEFLDARGADRIARKYRVMIIGGAFYPLHLAVSTDWKVHYFSSDMAANGAYRTEEQRFLEDMPGVLGPRAMAALAAIGQTLGLDYAGVDFALARDGSVVLFEANGTMVINPPEPDPIWDYRRAPIRAALDAAQRMVLAKAKRV